LRLAFLATAEDLSTPDCDREDDDPAEVGEVSGIAGSAGLEEPLGGLDFPSGLRFNGVL
jgi:hypothetical protein